MKIKLILLGVAILVVGAWLIASTMQLEETTLTARYEMLACEDCNHMTVEKSKDQRLVGKTIIPVSSAIDVEQIIEAPLDHSDHTKHTHGIRLFEPY